MMKYSKWIMTFVVLLLIHFGLFSQNDTLLLNNFSKEVIQPYIRNNNSLREQCYIHFNKSCYLPGEEVWFKAYVINPMTGLLNSYTRNLYVELYNENGKLIGHKILAVNEGTADNMFKIDDKELPGRYVFRAYTKWMKNFYTPEEFDRPLEVIGKSLREDSLKENIEYDVQFFPESGTLLTGIDNKIAIKALDPNGKSAVLKGIIFNERNDSVASFNLDKMGMGQVVLSPQNNPIYKAKVILPGGKEKTVSLPKVESMGVVASLNVFTRNRIMVEVKSNSETIKKERTFYILIHANGHVYQTYTTSLAPENTSVTFSLERQSVGNGVNYLTVFDENFHPVCERLFYNYKMDIKGKIDFTASTNKDTTEFSLKIVSDSVKHNFSRLSISVLPGGTVSNRFTSNLLSDILLRSGIRGKIENPQYYLEKQDNEHKVAMDHLMLTQGWRKYEWEKIKSDGNPDKRRELADHFENGFTIEGTVKNWLNGKESKNGSVSVLSPVNKFFSVANVDSAGCFSFKGLSLLDSSRVVVSAVNSKGNSGSRALTAVVNPDYKPDSIISVKSYIKLPGNTEKIEEPLKLMRGVIQLPEAVITGKKKWAFENSIYASPMDRVVEVTKDKIRFHLSLVNFLRTEFSVRLVFPTGTGDCKIDMGRGNWTAIRGQEMPSPKVYIDDDELYPDHYFILASFPLENIEAISVNKIGNATVGDAGAIFIKTRKFPLWMNETGPTNIKSLVVKGYSPPVEYYAPKYLESPESEVYQKYASIYWKPNVNPDSTGVSSFKFKVPEQINNVNVRIEGISNNGTVYLEERSITVK